MMRWTSVFLFLVLGVLARAGDLPWMGICLHSPDSKGEAEAILPQGMGLEVSKVILGSPADEAGTKEGDLWWKIDGQILINKGQMVVLLRTKKPGDQMKVDFYRDGELREISLTLGSRERRRFIPVDFREDKQDEARVLAKREKVARVKMGESDLSLESEGDQWRFKVRENGETILSALVENQNFEQRIPEKWHYAYVILQTTLAGTAEPSLAQVGGRTRYIPRAKGSNE